MWRPGTVLLLLLLWLLQDPCLATSGGFIAASAVGLASQRRSEARESCHYRGEKRGKPVPVSGGGSATAAREPAVGLGSDGSRVGPEGFDGVSEHAETKPALHASLLAEQLCCMWHCS